MFVIDGKRLGQSVYRNKPVLLEDAVVRLDKEEHELACLQPRNLGQVRILFDKSILYILTQTLSKKKGEKEAKVNPKKTHSPKKAVNLRLTKDQSI